ncbi:hypothetical protein J2S53_000128 [Actinopolyspora lacussalsi]|uniref:DUF397 domain-containing protein n=1 Tax=Actinopolyspora alba TaxID=673379 RepID=A0A1I2BBJ9_9ACTN|nr:DUF397 domain-containing protein [Actinopolyspora alba]MDP9640183.1 hypothetical protein [Actinopolyspora lacussalsi]SFE53525.1 protein of unknown function [Actinopolyspora alba]
MNAEHSITDWFISSYSGPRNNSCVEVRFTGHSTEVRDTKNRAAGTLAFERGQWNSFVRTLPDNMA